MDFEPLAPPRARGAPGASLRRSPLSGMHGVTKADLYDLSEEKKAARAKKTEQSARPPLGNPQTPFILCVGLSVGRLLPSLCVGLPASLPPCPPVCLPCGAPPWYSCSLSACTLGLHLISIASCLLAGICDRVI
jgi:hypothetical protein